MRRPLISLMRRARVQASRGSPVSQPAAQQLGNFLGLPLDQLADLAVDRRSGDLKPVVSAGARHQLAHDLVLLRGELGAGKTTLTKGIAAGFGAAAEEDVTSPTFTLVHEYRGPKVTVYHIDLYRVDTPRELETLGLDDLMGPHSLLLIEWGEKFARFERERDVEINLQRTGENDRKITLIG